MDAAGPETCDRSRRADLTEHKIDRIVAIAIAATALVIAGLIAALGFMVGWLPAAILFAAAVLFVFVVLVVT